MINPRSTRKGRATGYTDYYKQTAGRTPSDTDDEDDDYSKGIQFSIKFGKPFTSKDPKQRGFAPGTDKEDRMKAIQRRLKKAR